MKYNRKSNDGLDIKYLIYCANFDDLEKKKLNLIKLFWVMISACLLLLIRISPFCFLRSFSTPVFKLSLSNDICVYFSGRCIIFLFSIKFSI